MYLGLTWEIWSAIGLAVLLLTILHDRIDALLDRVAAVFTDLFGVAIEALGKLSQAIAIRADPIAGAVRRGALAIAPVIETMNRSLVGTAVELDRHRRSTTATVFRDEDLRSWHVIGAIVYGALLAVFVYADLSVGANALSAQFPEAEIPARLRGIVLPILAASAGTLIALGIVVADVLDRTHFVPWRTSGKTRIALLTYCAALALSAVTFAVLFGLTRLKGVEGINLSPSWVARIDSGAAISQAAIIAPMLMMTPLLWWGFLGLVVAYLLLLLAGERALLLLGLLLRLFQLVLGIIGGILAALTRIVIEGLRFIFEILAYLLRFMQTLLVGIIDIVGEVVLMVGWPGRQLAGLITGRGRRGHTPTTVREPAAPSVMPASTPSADHQPAAVRVDTSAVLQQPPFAQAASPVAPVNPSNPTPSPQGELQVLPPTTEPPPPRPRRARPKGAS
ncbi:MAG: hypothetical protein CVU47_04980 [Chloroflexi bacterium HGW-Chloroflexi-9]|nr:MAG: hypothetical protein CVU47_04980 [Chloroflexi bacterium HGW-Chloroflexi-9]